MIKVHVPRIIPSPKDLKKEFWNFVTSFLDQRYTIEAHPSRKGLVENGGEKGFGLLFFDRTMSVEDVLTDHLYSLPASYPEAQAFHMANPKAFGKYVKTVIAGSLIVIEGRKYVLTYKHPIPSLEPLETKFVPGTCFLLVLR